MIDAVDQGDANDITFGDAEVPQINRGAANQIGEGRGIDLVCSVDDRRAVRIVDPMRHDGVRDIVPARRFFRSRNVLEIWQYFIPTSESAFPFFSKTYRCVADRRFG